MELQVRLWLIIPILVHSLMPFFNDKVKLRSGLLKGVKDQQL